MVLVVLPELQIFRSPDFPRRWGRSQVSLHRNHAAPLPFPLRSGPALWRNEKVTEMLAARQLDPAQLLTPRRKITGISAILLPLLDDQVDWAGFDSHLERTFDAGLTPAVNMDTGYANLIDEATRTAVLRRTNEIAQGRPYVAGVFVGDSPGDAIEP